MYVYLCHRLEQDRLHKTKVIPWTVQFRNWSVHANDTARVDAIFYTRGPAWALTHGELVVVTIIFYLAREVRIWAFLYCDTHIFDFNLITIMVCSLLVPTRQKSMFLFIFFFCSIFFIIHVHDHTKISQYMNFVSSITSDLSLHPWSFRLSVQNL